MQKDEGKFDSWRENLPNEGAQNSGPKFEQGKSVDGMQGAPMNQPEGPQNTREKQPTETDVSKEGFALEKENQSNQNFQSQTPPDVTQEPQPTPPPSNQQTKEETTTPPPTEPKPATPSPTPAPKKGFPGWLKVILLIILALIIIGAAYLLVFYKSTLDVSVSAPGAKITLDNKSATAGTNKIKPGKYDLKIEKEGFAPYIKKVEVKYFKKTSLSIVLKETPEIISIYESEMNYLAYNKDYGLYLFYIPKEEAFYRIVADKLDEQKTAPVLTSPHYIKNVVDIVWNPDCMTAVIKIKNDDTLLNGTPFYNPKAPQGEIMTYLYDFGRYDLLHQEAKFWGTGIGDIEFTPKGDQVAYYFEPGTGEKSLVVANKDNSSINRIADLRSFERPVISWSPDLKNIVIVNRSTLYDTNKIFVFSLIDKTLNPVTDFGKNIEAIFDLKGEKIVYSTYSSDPDFENYSLLSVMDKDGQNKKELKVRSSTRQAIGTRSQGPET
ncbi:MAG: PEGA domain-containing protein [Candidatus Berkelbacteria bacterium]|nr:PEGA domain-containing protein [Candidatus Berkelbacteria bacterium]